METIWIVGVMSKEFDFIRKFLKVRAGHPRRGRDELITFFTDRYQHSRFRTWGGFTWGMQRMRWNGLIPQWAGAYYTGTLMSLLEDTPFVVRDYPVHPPYEELNSELVATQLPIISEMPDNLSDYIIQPWLNGIEVRFFNFPNGTFWGKSRFIEYVNRNARYNMNLALLLELSGRDKSVEQLCQAQNVSVFGTLVGKHIGGGFNNYQNVDSEFFIYDLVDMETDAFLHPDVVQQLSATYGIPYVDSLVNEQDIKSSISTEGGVIFKQYFDNGEIDIRYMKSQESPMDEEAEKRLQFLTDT